MFYLFALNTYYWAYWTRVGCGCGASTLAIAAAFPNAVVTGIDLDAAGIQKAEDESQRLGLRNVRFVLMDPLDAGKTE